MFPVAPVLDHFDRDFDAAVGRLCDLYGWSVRVVPGATRGVIATLSFRPDSSDAAVG